MHQEFQEQVVEILHLEILLVDCLGYMLEAAEVVLALLVGLVAVQMDAM
jgi:hypothetical protein